MSWLATKLFFKKSWVWLKEHWQVPFLVMWTLLVWIVARRNTEAMTQVIEAKRESYKKQVEVLRQSHKEELLERDKLIDEYSDTIAKLEKEFLSRKEELSSSHRKEVKKIIETSKGNPDEIKKRIKEEFGFELIE